MRLAIALLLIVPMGAAQTFDVTMHNDDGFYFVIEGLEGQNPTLQLEDGNTYTFNVENMGTAQHDFHVGSLGSTRLLSAGETDTLTVAIPTGASVSEYWCDPHKSAGMKGSIEMVSDDKESPGLPAVSLLAIVALAAMARRR